jgi:pyrimidine-nucleoside phosphorylase
VCSTGAGIVTECDAYQIGRAAFVLGAGRARADAAVHSGVGVLLHKKVGDRVEVGEPLVTLKVADRGLEMARTLVETAYVFGD